MTTAYLLFSIAPLLTSPLLPSLLPSLAPGKCFKSLVLITYQFNNCSLVFRPNNHSPTIFRKLFGWFCLLLWLSLLLQRNTRFFPLLLLFSLFWHYMRPNFPFFLATSNANLKFGGLLKRKKRLVKDIRLLLQVMLPVKWWKDRQAYFSASLHVSSPRLRHGRQLALPS